MPVVIVTVMICIFMTKSPVCLQAAINSQWVTVSHKLHRLFSPGVRNCNPTPDNICTLDVVRQFSLKHSKNLIISHYNVNSIRHDFCEISPIMNYFGVDILAIAESKLDDSFPSEQFNVCNYKLHRQDRDSHGVESWFMWIIGFFLTVS